MSKKRTVKKKDALNTYQKEQLRDIIHGDSVMNHDNFMDTDEYFDVERLSNVIISRVKNGESAEEIAYYKYEILKEVCQHLKVPGRSQWTTKMEMAKNLRKFIKGKDMTPKKSKETKKKKKNSEPKIPSRWMK